MNDNKSPVPLIVKDAHLRSSASYPAVDLSQIYTVGTSEYFLLTSKSTPEPIKFYCLVTKVR